MKLKYDTYYHGTTHRIDRVMDDFIGDGTDQEGPGIYFTSDFDDARSYGDFVYEVQLTPRAVMSKSDKNIGKISPLTVKRICKMAPDWKDTAQNWSENIAVGLNVFFKSTMEYNDNVFDVFQQIWIDFFKSAPREYVQSVVKATKYDAGIKDFSDGIQHVIVYNPGIIQVRKMHDFSKPTSDLREMVRNIVNEVVGQPAMAPGRTFDSEGLEAFMRQEGLFGHEEDIISIVEGEPNQKVINDVGEYIAFHKLGSDVRQLSADTILDYYLQWNNLNVDKNQVLAFSISET